MKASISKSCVVEKEIVYTTSLKTIRDKEDIVFVKELGEEPFIELHPMSMEDFNDKFLSEVFDEDDILEITVKVAKTMSNEEFFGKLKNKI